jgi:Ca2+-binding RTX toxin-like protein
MVDLATGRATGIGGVLSGISHATGGQANDILVGNALANILRGSAGRDLIIGGQGKDELHGGKGDDLLIGGTTAYDTNDTALLALLAEWSRTNAQYETRIKRIRTGIGGLNAGYALKGNVFDDDVADSLTGGEGRDWFWRDRPEDTARDRKPGERVS